MENKEVFEKIEKLDEMQESLEFLAGVVAESESSLSGMYWILRGISTEIEKCSNVFTEYAKFK